MQHDDENEDERSMHAGGVSKAAYSLSALHGP